MKYLDFKMHKKAQFESYLLAVITIVIVGIILLFFNHVADSFYSGFDQYFQQSPDYNNSEAHQSIVQIQDVENSAWDYVFLAIFIGIIIQILMFSFASRINAAFYWLMIIIDIPILIVGVILSNVWQEIAANPEFAVTITRFPITNTLLGTYFPVAVVSLLFLAMVVLFGKPSEQRIA